MTDALARRRADIDAKQAVLGRILAELDCEAAVLVVPAHLAWFTGGMNVRGLIAEGERPAAYTTGRTRWLVCGNADSQRLFDEELDGLGFMLKEWHWSTGRAQLLGEMVAGKKVAADRPFPGLPLLVDKLRPELRPLLPGDRDRYRELGQLVSHALEATARTFGRGESEQEIAGQIAHRLHRHGAEVHAVSVVADTRGEKFRRAGFTEAAVENWCTLQLTAARGGLYATSARTVRFAPLPPDALQAFDAACKLSAIHRHLSKPDGSLTDALDAGHATMKVSGYEHEWRLSQPGYGTGWFAADELRRAGVDERFDLAQPIVWQTRIGPAAVVDTVLVGEGGGEAVTTVEEWPIRRITIDGRAYDVPAILTRPE